MSSNSRESLLFRFPHRKPGLDLQLNFCLHGLKVPGEEGRWVGKQSLGHLSTGFPSMGQLNISFFSSSKWLLFSIRSQQFLQNIHFFLGRWDRTEEELFLRWLWGRWLWGRRVEFKSHLSQEASPSLQQKKSNCYCFKAFARRDPSSMN